MALCAACVCVRRRVCVNAKEQKRPLNSNIPWIINLRKENGIDKAKRRARIEESDLFFYFFFLGT